ncbi:RING/U-box superfamily protein [Striga hermonthica]|uniref:RBR-type E3 ubiquitin transferase n=1 Tax=Striga hermonthica TaxID=68872 RepID=A0A9N7NSS3_STRHE|nr:RING/U-box superfamily protein [Striga hermonthica]
METPYKISPHHFPRRKSSGESVVATLQMAPKASKTVKIPAAVAASKPDATPIEDFRPELKKNNIGLSRSSYSGDGEVKVLPSFLKFLKKVFRRGECPRPEPEDDTKPVPCSTFICEICAYEKPNGESFRISGCHHSYCADCVIRYVVTKLEDNIFSINCPVVGCNGLLEPQHCRSILPEQIFYWWGTEKFYCPFEDCSSLLFCERKGKNEVNAAAAAAASVCSYCKRDFCAKCRLPWHFDLTCDEFKRVKEGCKRDFCAKCRLPWHFGLTCDEFKRVKEGERSREDLLLMTLAKNKKWTRCPRCSIYIEKVNGCSLVTCRCRCTLCYYCGSVDLPFIGHTCKKRRNSKPKASKTVKIPAVATKPDAIAIEDCHPKSEKEKIGLSLCLYSDDGEPEDATKPVPYSTFICEICADEKPNEESFGISGCHHSYCANCVIRYVVSKLEDNIVSIKCPVPGCIGLLEPQHCQSILPEQVFDQWGYALCEAAILDTEKFYCPFKDCSALLFCEEKGKNKVNVAAVASVCSYCKRDFCAKCMLPWHFGLTCDEFKWVKEGERSREDLLLMSLAKSKKWTRCPRCSIYVEKVNGGCSYVNCRFDLFSNFSELCLLIFSI